MWIIAMWLAIGIVVGVAGFLIFWLIADHLDSAHISKRSVVRAQQGNADAQMQSVVQSTITEMFNAARGYR